MKKFIIALLAALILLPAQAEKLTWSRYNLNFWIPEGGYDGFFNSSTYYEHRWDEMNLTIQLYNQDKEQKKEIYYTSLERKAQGFSMYDCKRDKVKVKNFDGYEVEGIMPDGTRCLLVNLVSKKSDLVVQIIVNYYFGEREIVDDIVKSFAENKDQQPNIETKKQKIQKPDPEVEKKAKEEQEALRKQEKEREYQQKVRSGEIRTI